MAQARRAMAGPQGWLEPRLGRLQWRYEGPPYIAQVVPPHHSQREPLRGMLTCGTGAQHNGVVGSKLHRQHTARTSSPCDNAAHDSIPVTSAGKLR